jgi:transposase, IS30 family
MPVARNGFRLVRRTVGCPGPKVLFIAGLSQLSTVFRLAGGREVVVKHRPACQRRFIFDPVATGGFHWSRQHLSVWKRSMARKGRKRRLELDALYWDLIRSGVGTVEACREAGIGRKAGFRWRHETGGLPPARLGEREHCGRYLSRFERQRIAALNERGIGVREIARRMGRAPSTISRELRRNRSPHDRGGYDSELAHARARERSRRPKVAKLASDFALRATVAGLLELEWSPEQISVHLRTAFPKRTEWHLCPETIYQALYLPGRGGLTRELTRRPRTGRPMGKRRRRPDQRRVRFAVPGASIATRPAQVLVRDHPGHWEGDLIVGRNNRSAIGTLVERHSRYVRLVHLPAGHSADDLYVALTRVLLTIPRDLRLTLTWDQGGEMARHHEIAQLLAHGVYFTDPGCPWQRGTNENTNGLLRQYFPKSSDLSVHSDEVLRHVEHRLNHRPRKTLGWATPASILTERVRS